jgi:hypothetical protein
VRSEGKRELAQPEARALARVPSLKSGGRRSRITRGRRPALGDQQRLPRLSSQLVAREAVQEVLTAGLRAAGDELAEVAHGFIPIAIAGVCAADAPDPGRRPRIAVHHAMFGALNGQVSFVAERGALRSWLRAVVGRPCPDDDLHGPSGTLLGWDGDFCRELGNVLCGAAAEALGGALGLRFGLKPPSLVLLRRPDSDPPGLAARVELLAPHDPSMPCLGAEVRIRLAPASEADFEAASRAYSAVFLESLAG